MKKLLAIALLLSGTAWAGTCGNGYGLVDTLRLQKAVNTNQTNYPYPLVGTYTPLKTVANGGQVTHTANNSIGVSGPADLVFCDASSGGNALKYEVAQYDATTGAFEIWVQIPTLHTASFDNIYMFIGNNSVSTTQQDLTLWSDVSYLQVCHLPDGSTLNVNCSLGGTQTNHSATAVAGMIDGAANTVAASSQWIDTGSAQNAPSFTYEVWVKPTSFSSNMPLLDNINGGNGEGFLMGQSGANGIVGLVTVSGGSSFECIFTSGAVANIGIWVSLAVTKTSSGSANVKLYANGTLQTNNSTCASLAQVNGGTNSRIGSELGAGSFANAAFDEVRYSSVVRSADWIATNYQLEKQLAPTYQIVGQSFTSPTIINATTCATDGTASPMPCVMPFPVATGNMLIVAVATKGGTNACNGGGTTDTVSNTFTVQASSFQTNAGNDGYTCIISAPVTTSGADTVNVSNSSNTWAEVYEVAAIKSTGIATASTNATQPSTMTATAPSNNSFLICATETLAGTLPTSTTPGTYTLRTVAGFPPPFAYRYLANATGVVSSGSNSCSFNSGEAGSMAIFGLAAPAGHKRPSQVY